MTRQAKMDSREIENILEQLVLTVQLTNEESRCTYAALMALADMGHEDGHLMLSVAAKLKAARATAIVQQVTAEMASGRPV